MDGTPPPGLTVVGCIWWYLVVGGLGNTERATSAVWFVGTIDGGITLRLVVYCSHCK